MSSRRTMMMTFSYVKNFIKQLLAVPDLSYYFENETELEKVLNELNIKDALTSPSTGLSYPSFLLTNNFYKDVAATGTGTRKAFKMPLIPNKFIGDYVQNTDATKVNSAGEIILNAEQNLLTNSDVFMNQSMTLPAGTYNISFYGAGTITLTGVVTISKFGIDSNTRVNLTFTSSITGTLNLSKSGTVLYAQLTNTNSVQTYMPTLLRKGIPRYDYTFPSKPGLLLESDRTNFILNSENFQTQTVAVLPVTPSVLNRSYVLSFYGTGSITISSTSSNTVRYNTYLGNDQQTSTIVDLSTTSKTLTGLGNDKRVFITIQDNTGSSITFTKGNSGTVIKPQFEYGGTTAITVRPSSYIPTTGGSVATRGASYLKVINSDTLGYTGSVFTFFVELQAEYWNQAIYVTFCSDTNGSVGVISLRNSTKLYLTINGGDSINTDFTFNGSNKTVLTVDTSTNEIGIWQNGAAVANSPFTPSITLPQIKSFNLGGGLNSSVIFKTVAIWPGKLPDAQCLKLSTF